MEWLNPLKITLTMVSSVRETSRQNLRDSFPMIVLGGFHVCADFSEKAQPKLSELAAK